MNPVLIQLKPIPDGFPKAIAYALATDFMLLAKPTGEDLFKYRTHRPGRFFDGHGIHTSDISQIFDLDYAKTHYPEFFL